MFSPTQPAPLSLELASVKCMLLTASLLCSMTVASWCSENGRGKLGRAGCCFVTHLNTCKGRALCGRCGPPTRPGTQSSQCHLRKLWANSGTDSLPNVFGCYIFSSNMENIKKACLVSFSQISSVVCTHRGLGREEHLTILKYGQFSVLSKVDSARLRPEGHFHFQPLPEETETRAAVPRALHSQRGRESSHSGAGHGRGSQGTATSTTTQWLTAMC